VNWTGPIIGAITARGEVNTLSVVNTAAARGRKDGSIGNRVAELLGRQRRRNLIESGLSGENHRKVEGQREGDAVPLAAGALDRYNFGLSALTGCYAIGLSRRMTR